MTTLFTPVRRALLKVKPAAILGKRVRDEERFEFSDLDPVVDTPPSSDVSFSFTPSPPAHCPTTDTPAQRIALQNEDSDPSFADTVVITTLDNIPFCCHEDLLTMTRMQLLEVIRKLNEKLPTAMKILVHCQMTKRDLRRQIEVVVGLRDAISPDLPKTPKLNRKVPQEKSFAFRMVGVDGDEPDHLPFSSPPTSPLARWSRATPTPRLDRLVEEDEGPEDSPMSVDTRPYKRRRRASDIEMGDDASPTPLCRQGIRQRTRIKRETLIFPTKPKSLASEDPHRFDFNVASPISRPSKQNGKENDRCRRASGASDMDLSF